MFPKSKSHQRSNISSPEKQAPDGNSPIRILSSNYSTSKENSPSLSSLSKTYEENSKLNDSPGDSVVLGSNPSKTYAKLPQLPEFLKIKLPYNDTNTASWLNQDFKSISKTNSHGNCSGKSIEMLQDVENILSTQFYYCLNQNHILKREIAFAKAVVKREIFSNSDNFAELLKKAVEGKWKGREELILHLKEKIRYLTTLIEKREKDLNKQKVPIAKLVKNSTETFHAEPVSYFSSLEEEKEKLLIEQQQLREKLEYFSKTNKDLAEEASYLKKETNKTTSSSSDDLYKKLRDLEIQIKHCLTRKSQVIKSLTEEEFLTYQHVTKIAELKNQIQKDKEVVEESEKRLKSLKSDDRKNIIEKVRNGIIANSSHSIKTLEDMARKYHKQLNHLRLFVNDDNTISSISIDNPKHLIKSHDLSVANDKQNVNFRNLEKRSLNQFLTPIHANRKTQKILRFRSPLTSEISFPALTNGTFGYKPSLLEVFYKVKSSCERHEENNLDRLTNIYVHLEKVRDTVQQLLQNQFALFNLSYKIKQLSGIYRQLCSKNIGKKSETYGDEKCLAHAALFYGAKIVYCAMKDENKFLSYCIDRVYNCREDDIDFLISGTSEIENFFRNSLCI